MNSTVINKINTYVDDHKDQLFSYLSRLIQFDTQNYIEYGKEQECQEYIKEKFEKFGLQTEIYYPDDLDNILEHPDYMPGRGTDKRPNVCGTLHGEKADRILISAHVDTMPIGDEKAWTVNPLGGLIKDGKIFGRGSNDNKFGIALLIFIAEMFSKLRIKPEYTFDFLSYVDEEYGGGNGALAGSLRHKYKNTISLDAANYELWVSSLGGCIFQLKLQTNKATDNANDIIDAVCVLKSKLDLFGERQRHYMHVNPLFTGSDMEKSAFRYYDLRIGEKATNVDRGTLNCVYYTDRSKEDSLLELKQYIEMARVELKDTVQISDPILTTRFFHYLKAPEDSKAISHMKKCAEYFVDYEIKQKGACLSDLSLFMKYGSEDSFGFGVMRDFSLYGGAHQADEFVDCNELVNLTKAVALFISSFDK